MFVRELLETIVRNFVLSSGVLKDRDSTTKEKTDRHIERTKIILAQMRRAREKDTKGKEQVKGK